MLQVELLCTGSSAKAVCDAAVYRNRLSLRDNPEGHRESLQNKN